MSTGHTLENMIKRAHTRYRTRLAVHEQLRSRESEATLQRSYEKLDKLIAAYQDPAAEKKACIRCGNECFALYDYVRRDGKRSTVCKTCEAKSYSTLYAQTRRLSVFKNDPIVPPSKMSHLTRAVLLSGIKRDYNLTTSQLRWRLKNMTAKLDGYTRMEMAGVRVRPQDQRSVARTVKALALRVMTYEMLYKDQIAEVKSGRQPRDLATLYADWQRKHGS